MAKFNKRKRPDDGVRVMFSVYAKDRVLGERPITYVDRVTRDEYLACGAAQSINGGQAIRMTLCLSPNMPQSLSMGPSVIEGNAGDKGFARELVEAWRPKFRIVACAEYAAVPA